MTVGATNPLNLELKGYSFSAELEGLRPPRRVRVGLIQNSIVLPTTEPIAAQRDALLSKIGQIIGVAHLNGVNIICMQEAWSKLSTFRKEIYIYFLLHYVSPEQTCHSPSALERNIHGVSLLSQLRMDPQLFFYKK